MASAMILEVLEDGAVIKLDSGQAYSVNPGDTPSSICWYGSQRVWVTKTRDGGPYPYLIKNLDTYGEQTVRASPGLIK